MDKSAIEAIRAADTIQAARVAISEAVEVGNGAMVALPGDFQMHDLERTLPTRRRMRGKMVTPSLVDFCSFVRDFAEPGAGVFIDRAKLQATAVLNLGTYDRPGHGDNLARLDAEPTAAYQALQRATSGALTQSAAAEFLEDWADCVRCVGADAAPIATNRAIAAVRKLSIEHLRKLESEQQQLRATTSTFEDVQVKSSEAAPSLVVFRCEPTAFLPAREFSLRLGVQTGGKEPTIVLRMIKRELHEQEMAEELQRLLIKQLAERDDADERGVGVKVAIGSYTPAD